MALLVGLMVHYAIAGEPLWVALAGPVTNLLLAVASAVLLKGLIGTASVIPYCHPIRIDWVGTEVEIGEAPQVTLLWGRIAEVAPEDRAALLVAMDALSDRMTAVMRFCIAAMRLCIALIR